MIKRLPLPCLLSLTFLFTACEDSNRVATPENSEDILKEAVPVDSKQQAELQKETAALKAKREEAKADLEKFRKEAASLKERVEALEKGDLTKASSGNTDDAAAARLAPPPVTPAGVSSSNAAKVQMENQLITLNLRRLCEMAETQMDLTGKKSLGFEDLVGSGKSIPTLTSHAGEIYAGLLFTPEKKIYEVTTIDGRTIRYERGK